MTRNLVLYLEDIIHNMRLAQQFIGNLALGEFIRDPKTVYAVLRCLEIIGEAAKNVPASLREKYPAIPWKSMAGMLDRLTHFYFVFSDEKVWRTVAEEIPNILPLMEQACNELKSVETSGAN
jgi:uncharacterized protein with HEPN domain